MTWNTRGWGAQFAEIDQAVKAKCLLSVLEAKGAGLTVLTDLKFRENGVKEYWTAKQK